METTIKSWRNKKVRIKDEYIKKEEVIDGNASTFDYDSDCYTDIVYMESEYIDTPNGMVGVFRGYEREVFTVVLDCYGVDLYSSFCQDRNISELPKPTHQIMVKREIKTSKPIKEWDYYEFLWDSKYFEVVTKKVTKITEWVVDEEYK